VSRKKPTTPESWDGLKGLLAHASKTFFRLSTEVLLKHHQNTPAFEQEVCNTERARAASGDSAAFRSFTAELMLYRQPQHRVFPA
jgi:hypothetical protein